MKRNSQSYFSLFSLLRPTGSQITKVFPVPKVWEGISPKLKKLILLIYGRSSLVPVRCRLIFSFSLFLVKMYKNHGGLYSVKWLKACYVSLQRYCGDNRVDSLREIEENIPYPRMINGLPAIIHKGDRKKIQNFHKPTIQFWLSVFSMYRVIETGYNIKLSPILDPFTGDPDGLKHIETFIEKGLFSNYFKTLTGYDYWVKNLNLSPRKLTFIQSASPSNNVSWHGMITDLILARFNGVDVHFDEYLSKVGNKFMNRVFSDIMDITEAAYPIIEKRWNADPVVIKNSNFLKNACYKGDYQLPWVPCHKGTNFSKCVGQLSFKEEAAGKLRIFAMVDFWTQNILKPLHDELFVLLRKIPNDGTFDQDASVKRSIEKSKISGKAYSFDLSSATDRLPISIQWRLIDLITGIPIGIHWKNILVDRDYFVPEGYGEESQEVRYAVGQPMGAYSSWAMLAITHHWILQYASFGLGRRGWEEGYEILGDDLVIFDSELASKYLEITKILGVSINLSKSIVSPNRPSFEFAKRMICDSVNVSAVSLKQLISETSMAARVNNLIYFSRLGLIRTNLVLKTIISRFDFKSDKDLIIPLISLLGYFLNSGRLTLKDILSALCDYRNEEWDLDSPVSLPTQSLLNNLKGLCWELSGKERHSWSLPHMEDREDLAEENELLLSDMIVLHCLSEAKKIERNFEQWVKPLTSRLFGSFSYDLSEMLISPNDWLVDHFHNNRSDYDPSDMVDVIEKIAIKQAKIHNLDVKAALDLLDRVESYRRLWSIGVVKSNRSEMAKEKASPIFRYILENNGRRGNLSYLKARPYWS